MTRASDDIRELLDTISGKFNKHIWIGKDYNLLDLEETLTQILDKVSDLETEVY